MSVDADLRNTKAAIERLRNADPMPLLKAWADVLDEDNRRGVMAGLDKDDRPMPPLKSRKGKASRRPVRAIRRGRFARTAEPQIGPDAGARGAERRGPGPRLAPRKEASRVISNYGQEISREGDTYVVEGLWIDVVSAPSKKSPGGDPFLRYHFDPEGNRGKGLRPPMPKYDLRGIRRWGRIKLEQLKNAWINAIATGADVNAALGRVWRGPR